MDREKISLKKSDAKVKVLSFQASSCTYCKQQVDVFNKLTDRFEGDSDVEFISVFLSPDYEVHKLTDGKARGFHVVADGRYYADLVGIKKYPVNMVIDEYRRITYIEYGFQSDLFEQLEFAVKREL